MTALALCKITMRSFEGDVSLDVGIGRTTHGSSGRLHCESIERRCRNTCTKRLNLQEFAGHYHILLLKYVPYPSLTLDFLQFKA